MRSMHPAAQACLIIFMLLVVAPTIAEAFCTLTGAGYEPALENMRDR